MDNVDRLDLAKDMLRREIKAATSSFDLAKRLWDAAGLECKTQKFSEFVGMMPVLAVFETIPDGDLYYKQLDPNTAQEWLYRDWMGADDVETSLAQFSKEELTMVKHNMRYLRDHERDRESGRRYVCLAQPEWLRNEYEGDALRKAIYQSL